MSRSLIACASLLLAALTLATPAAAQPHRDRPSSTGEPVEAESAVLRQRVERQIARASRQLDELARSGTLTPQQLARAQALRERVAGQTRHLLADEPLTADDQRAVRALKREARAFRRELRAALRSRRHVRS